MLHLIQVVTSTRFIGELSDPTNLFVFKVKVFSRTNDYFDDATENTIQDFFKANLTCVDYNSLRESKHSQRSK